MVHIKLDSKFAITADTLQWILLQDERPRWFFPTLQDLLIAYLSMKTRGCGAFDVQQLMNYQNQLLQSLTQALNTHTRDIDTKLPLLKKEEKHE